MKHRVKVSGLCKGGINCRFCYSTKTKRQLLRRLTKRAIRRDLREDVRRNLENL